MAIGEIQSFEKRKVACAKCGGSEEKDLISCKGPRCSLVYHAGIVIGWRMLSWSLFNRTRTMKNMETFFVK